MRLNSTQPQVIIQKLMIQLGQTILPRPHPIESKYFHGEENTQITITKRMIIYLKLKTTFC